MRCKLLLFLFLFSVNSYSQEYQFQNITTKDGLASNNINCIFKDSKGFMWFGTGDGGVSKYDGKAFTNYNTESGLPNNDVRCVFEDKEGKLWFATHGGGVSIFDGKTFSSLDEKSGLSNNRVYVISQDPSGTMWFGTWGGGLCSYNGKKFTTYSEKEGGPRFVISMFLDKKGRLWVGSHLGKLICIINGKFKIYGKEDGFNENAVWGFDEDSKGNIWFTSYGTNFAKYDGEKFTYITNEGGALSRAIPIKIDSQDNLWIGHAEKGGVEKWNGKTLLRLGSSNGLLNPTNWSLYIDKSNTVWIGSSGGGVFKLKSESIVRYGSLQGLTDNVVNTITQDKNNKIWIGTDTAGLFYLENNTFKSFLPLQKISKAPVATLLMDRKSTLWIGLFGLNYSNQIGGIFTFDGKKINIVDTNNLNSSCHPIVSFEDSHGNIWFGNWLSGGVNKWDGKSFFGLNNKKIYGRDITAINEDRYGNMYFATHGAILKMDKNDSVKAIKKEDGLADIETSQIFRDKYNLLWFCHAKGGGISILDVDKKKWRYLTTKEGLLDNKVLSVVEDKNGDVWIATGKGLNKIIRPSKDNFVFEKIDNGTSLSGQGCINLFVDRNNQLYVAAENNGLYKININNLPRNMTAPILSITTVYLNYKKINWQKGDSLQNAGITFSTKVNSTIPEKIIFNYDQNTIGFDFVGIEHYSPEKVTYSWILEGLEMKWSPFSSINHINYSSLPSGKYNLKVVAKNEFGVMAKPPLEYEFTIVPPFWKTNWFYVLYILVFIASVFFFIRARETSLRKQKQFLEKKVKERTSDLIAANESINIQKTELEEKNKEVMDSIHYAKRLQEAILPSAKKVNELLPNSFIIYQPKDIIAGDFYWMEKTDDLVLFAAADCTGHGVPGALVSFVCSNALHKATMEMGVVEPGKILDAVREFVIEQFSKSESDVKDGMDISLCSLNTNTNELIWAGANNPLWIIRNNETIIEEFKPNKQPVGKSENAVLFTSHKVQLYKGDSLYIFSDGIVDQFGGESGKKYKSSNLKKLLCSISNSPLDKQKEIIETNFSQWKKGFDQTDDVCFIGIKI